MLNCTDSVSNYLLPSSFNGFRSPSFFFKLCFGFLFVFCHTSSFLCSFLVYNLVYSVSHAVKSGLHHPPPVTLRCSHSMSETPELERVWLIVSRRSNTLFKDRASITNKPALTMLVRIEYRSHATTTSSLSPVIHSFTIH